MLNLTNKIINPEKLSYDFFPKSSKNSKGMQVIKATDTKRSIRFHSVIYTIKNNICKYLFSIYLLQKIYAHFYSYVQLIKHIK